MDCKGRLAKTQKCVASTHRCELDNAIGCPEESKSNFSGNDLHPAQSSQSFPA